MSAEFSDKKSTRKFLIFLNVARKKVSPLAESIDVKNGETLVFHRGSLAQALAVRDSQFFAHTHRVMITQLILVMRWWEIMSDYNLFIDLIVIAGVRPTSAVVRRCTFRHAECVSTSSWVKCVIGEGSDRRGETWKANPIHVGLGCIKEAKGASR